MPATKLWKRHWVTHVLLQRTGLLLPQSQACDCNVMSLGFQAQRLLSPACSAPSGARDQTLPRAQCPKQLLTSSGFPGMQSSLLCNSSQESCLFLLRKYSEIKVLIFFLPWTLWDNPDHHNREEQDLPSSFPLSRSTDCLWWQNSPSILGKGVTFLSQKWIILPRMTMVISVFSSQEGKKNKLNI